MIKDGLYQLKLSSEPKKQPQNGSQATIRDSRKEKEPIDVFVVIDATHPWKKTVTVRAKDDSRDVMFNRDELFYGSSPEEGRTITG